METRSVLKGAMTCSTVESSCGLVGGTEVMKQSLSENELASLRCSETKSSMSQMLAAARHSRQAERDPESKQTNLDSSCAGMTDKEAPSVSPFVLSAGAMDNSQ